MILNATLSYQINRRKVSALIFTNYKSRVYTLIKRFVFVKTFPQKTVLHMFFVEISFLAIYGS